MTKTQLLFFVILVESYVVLATELLAIRTLIPFVGSGTETVSIIISAVLLPLAFGYHAGGNAFKNTYAKSKIKNGKKLSIRKILLRNITWSLFVLTMGLSYVFQEAFFANMVYNGITNKLAQTSIYCVLYLSLPVFLLAQTVPLISNYFSRQKLSQITGKMLFFSTSGSFMGSVFSTIILMTYVGVNYTIIFTLSLLCVLIFMLMKRILSREAFFCIIILSVLYLLNCKESMNGLNIVSHNAYNTITVDDDTKNNIKTLSANNSIASRLSSDHEKRFEYINYINDYFIYPKLGNGSKSKDILVIGAGGFTVGLEDKSNNYTFVDIDPDLKDVAEKYFLNSKLSPNKKFVAASAREFLHDETQKYDLIVVDVYSNLRSIPMECITREFFLELKKAVNIDGVIVMNVISSPTFSDKFTVRYYNTFASVFPVFTRQVVQLRNDADLLKKNNTADDVRNILYIYYNSKYVDDNTVYTDNKNSYSIDRH